MRTGLGAIGNSSTATKNFRRIVAWAGIKTIAMATMAIGTGTTGGIKATLLPIQTGTTFALKTATQHSSGMIVWAGSNTIVLAAPTACGSRTTRAEITTILPFMSGS